jgi:dihydrofolate synthase/folylpolyglutamate synthase
MNAAAPSALDALLASLKTLHPMLIDLSLERIERLLARLGHPERRLPPVIHVAGTNGKGSTCAYLKAMLEASGRRCHVYTSPHLIRFNERIQLPGPDGRTRPIPEPALIAALEHVRAVNDGAPITFFEITTAAAFHVFATTPADALVLEVGLGGRLDTTNVVAAPAVTVITPIAMDHAEKLGSTLARIAGEKVGILKRGVPCIVAPQDDEVLDVIRARAQNLGAPLVVAGADYDAYEQNGRLVFQSEHRLLDLPRPALIGRHQILNAGTAVATALQLPGLISIAGIERGLVDVRWPARMQRLGPGPLQTAVGPNAELWLDGGHNPAGGRAIADTLAMLDDKSPKTVVLVVGMMGLKDTAGFLGHFKGLVRRVLTVPIPGAHEPPKTPGELAEIARRAGLDAAPALDLMAALRTISAMAGGPYRVLICGSLYLAGHVLALHEGAYQQSN